MLTVRRWLLAAALTICTVVAGLVTAATPAQAANLTATVRTGGIWLNIRAAATAQSVLTGRLKDRSKVTIACKVTGQSIRGALRSTNQWDRLTSGQYISHAYVNTSASIATCPPPVPIGGPQPGMTNPQFIAASVAPAQQGFRQFGVPASVTIAQAILESGWGRSGLAADNRNFFGIKCFGSPGPIANGCRSYPTSECALTCYPTTATFRTYPSAAASFLDHGKFLVSNSRYRPAFAYTRDADNFLYQIWRAGYASSPTYMDRTKSLMRQYNLYQYDRI
jgi:flagellar protein FlgJ